MTHAHTRTIVIFCSVSRSAPCVVLWCGVCVCACCVDLPSDPNDPVRIAWLGGEAVDPVEEVEGAVAAQGEDVVRGEGLHLAGALEEEELRQDGQRLEVDGEGPQDLEERELGVEHQRQQERRADEEHHAERIVLPAAVGVEEKKKRRRREHDETEALARGARSVHLLRSTDHQGGRHTN